MVRYTRAFCTRLAAKLRGLFLAVSRPHVGLALPNVADAIAIFGGGYAVSVLKLLAWLRDRNLVYWGDLDTHGFAILDQVRTHHPHARSPLMDRVTLLEHESQWVREPRPTNLHLTHLTPERASLIATLSKIGISRRFGWSRSA
jgi:hypothetical protein